MALQMPVMITLPTKRIAPSTWAVLSNASSVTGPTVYFGVPTTGVMRMLRYSTLV